MLPLALNLSSAAVDGFSCDEPQFRNTDTRGTDGLHKQIEALVLLGLGGTEKTFVFGFGEFTVTGRKDLPLNLQILDEEVVLFAEDEEAVEGGNGSVDAGWNVGVHQMCFVG